MEQQALERALGDASDACAYQFASGDGLLRFEFHGVHATVASTPLCSAVELAISCIAAYAQSHRRDPG